ncbi:hypothetical protein D9M69_618130 [compost metagenome]
MAIVEHRHKPRRQQQRPEYQGQPALPDCLRGDYKQAEHPTQQQPQANLHAQRARLPGEQMLHEQGAAKHGETGNGND